MSMDTWEQVPSETRGTRSLQLGLQLTVSHLTWVLDTELEVSARAAFDS